MSWLIKDKLETTGDFQLDYILKRMYAKELRNGYQIVRVKDKDYQLLPSCFKYNKMYSHYQAIDKLHYILYIGIFHEPKIIYVFIDTED